MPDKSISRDTREGRGDNTVIIGLVLAAVLGVLILLGARAFDFGGQSVDVNATQPGTETPATGSTEKP